MQEKIFLLHFRLRKIYRTHNCIIIHSIIWDFKKYILLLRKISPLTGNNKFRQRIIKDTAVEKSVESVNNQMHIPGKPGLFQGAPVENREKSELFSKSCTAGMADAGFFPAFLK